MGHDPMMSDSIVRLGARCDLVSEDARDGLSFAVTEFADLVDGRRVELDHRGWSISRSRGSEGAERDVELWQYLTRSSLEQDVRNVVLPDDDATAAVHEHDWQHLASCAAAAGLDVTAEALSKLDYVVELSEELLARTAP